jgi:hypothetical protein
MILRQWAQSPKTELQRGFIEVAFGKVPTQIEIRDWRKAAEAASKVTGNAVPGWCEQMREAGYEVWVDPNTVRWHPWPRPGQKGGMAWIKGDAHEHADQV